MTARRIGRSGRCSSRCCGRGRDALIDLRLPYRPQANGKVERFNLTLTDARPYEYNSSRADVLERWLHDYNYHWPQYCACGQATDLGRKQLPRKHHSSLIGRLPKMERTKHESPGRSRIAEWIAVALISALPWSWFAIRDVNPAIDAVASILPAAAAAAGLASLVWALVTRRIGFALVALSFVVIAIVVVVEPRLAQPSQPPLAAFRLVSSNTLDSNPTPAATIDALLRWHPDVLIAVETRRVIADGLARAFQEGHTQEFGELTVSSTWPVRALDHVPGIPASERVMRVEILRPGAPFIVYAIHLLNPLGETSFAQQGETIRRLLIDAQGERLPVVLAGDFNMSDRSSSYRALNDSFRDAMRASSFAHTTYDGGLWSLLQFRIDYVFVSSSWCAGSAKTFTVPGSDHDGLEVDLGACPS